MPLNEYRAQVECPICGETSNRTFYRPPVCHGLSDGPGSCVNQIVFNRPDLEKEYRITFQKMEESGRFRDPSVKKQAEFMMDWAKAQPKEKIDYDKGGHPLDD